MVLKKELQLKSPRVTSDQIPLAEELDNFFKTLAQALFIVHKERPHELIRISYQGQEDHPISIDRLCDPILSATEGPKVLKLKKTSPSGTCNDVLAIIKNDAQRTAYIARMNGLGMTLQDEGATAWSILSSPIKPLVDFLNFHYDAFVTLTLENSIAESTLVLVNNDIRKNESFIEQPMRNLVSGALQSHYSQAPKAIELGSLIARIALAGGIETREGLLIRINQANEHNELPGQYIRMRILDDQYNPALTQKKVIELKERNIDVLVIPYGTPTTEVYLDDVKNGKILVLFPQSGGLILSNPDLGYMFHFKGNNVLAAQALIDYLIKHFNVRKFALYYQNDSFGKTPLHAATTAFEKYDDIEWIEVPYTRGSLELQEQAKKIKSFRPDALGLFSFGEYSQELIRNIGIDSLTSTLIFGTYDAGDISSRIFFKKVGLTPVYLSSNVPNPEMNAMPIAQAYRKAMNLYGVAYDTYSFEAYIAGSITVDALKKIDGPITKDTIKQKLESYNNYQFEGLTLTFNPKNRSLSDSVWFEQGEKKLWKKLV